VLHLRRRLESAVSSSQRDATLPYESAMQMIHALIYCDEFEDIATLKVRPFHSFNAFSQKFH
jgi:nuclear receptor subfamily 6 group A